VCAALVAVVVAAGLHSMAGADVLVVHYWLNSAFLLQSDHLPSQGTVIGTYAPRQTREVKK